MRNRIKNTLTIAALGAGLFAFTGATPARADRYNDLRNAVRHDLDRVANDQKHLDDLRDKLDRQRQHGDFRAVRHTQDDMERARIDLQRDRDNLRIDQRQLERRRW